MLLSVFQYPVAASQGPEKTQRAGLSNIGHEETNPSTTPPLKNLPDSYALHRMQWICKSNPNYDNHRKPTIWASKLDVILKSIWSAPQDIHCISKHHMCCRNSSLTLRKAWFLRGQNSIFVLKDRQIPITRPYGQRSTDSLRFLSDKWGVCHWWIGE